MPTDKQGNPWMINYIFGRRKSTEGGGARLLMMTAVSLFLFPAAVGYGYPVHYVIRNVEGRHVGTCRVVLPDEKPMAEAQTLVVDNALPNGTEIISWGYGRFSPAVIDCRPRPLTVDNDRIDDVVSISLTLNSSNSSKYFKLSDDGLGLQIWVKSSKDDSGSDSGAFRSYAYTSAGHVYMSANNELEISNYGHRLVTVAQYQQAEKYIVDGMGEQYHLLPLNTSLKIRAAIIKIGTLQYNGPLSTHASAQSPSITARSKRSTVSLTQNLFSGSGIRIIPPSCQLKTKDYSIPLGKWAADTITREGTPAYGAQKPIEISLKCSGKINHVRFRFEDAGSSALTNKNISLYDAAGGNKINGLEVELLRNGSRINVDNSTRTDTGSHGSASAIDATSTTTFTARYIQRAAITRSDSPYTGPVTGKVNMHVTYD